jgi:fucose permease
LKQHHLNALIVFSALAGTAITLCIPMLTSLWTFFALLFLSGIATAPFWPSIQSYCADRLHENDTTMLFILLSCSGVPGCAFFAWLMGYLGDRANGLTVAFYLVPACYLILALLIGCDWLCLNASKHRNTKTNPPVR